MRYTLRVSIPGDWRDAWMYKEKLFLWSRSGRIHFCDLTSILETVRKASGPSTAALVEYLILRNDWKSSGSFRRLMELPDVRSAFLQEFREGGGELAVVLKELQTKVVPGSEPTGYMYDCQLYANRLFEATSEGFFISYLNPKYLDRYLSIDQVLDFETVAVKAKYSCVNVSAEGRGLWFSPLDFTGDYEDPFEAQIEQVADSSISCSFASRNLLNYTDAPVPGFLKAHEDRGFPHARAQYEDWKVTGYEQQIDISSLTMEAVAASKRVTYDDLPVEHIKKPVAQPTVIGNSNYRMLVEQADKLHVVNISAYPADSVAARRDSAFKVSSITEFDASQIISTHAIASGFVVELYDKVIAITHNGAFDIYQNPAARVRSFGESRRHQDVTAVIGEDDVSLIGFLDLGVEEDPQF